VRTLADIFRQTVRDRPEHPALDNGVDVLTYAELAEAAEEVTAELNPLGIGVGDRVGVRIRSGSTELYTAIVGILLAGAAYVPVRLMRTTRTSAHAPCSPRPPSPRFSATSC
jgi:non-ribosomal peptide synthetase component F